MSVHKRRAFGFMFVAVLITNIGSVAIADCDSSKKKESKSMQTTVTKDIVDTAVSNGSFNTLVSALKAAGLVDTLKGPGPFTVFAPTDEAFKKIPNADLQALLADKAKLTAVLTYHVLPGSVKAGEVTDGKAAKTVQGSDVHFSLKDGKAKIEDATITATDIATSNGVIHVIDTVIMPKN
ncbi:MAG: fasciclin domain-containing protein [Candidatus Obscuribacterales bacterium]|nr:fasciclin domain-containing protein [Candidatus Obscuribacterales bacterium]